MKKTTKIVLILALISSLVSCTKGSGNEEPSVSFSGYPETAFTIKNEADLIGGPLAQGRIGDVLLENDKIQVVIQKPSKNAGLFSFGGVIIDADRKRVSNEKENDNFGAIIPFVNVEWTVNYYNYEVMSTGEDGGPKILRAYGVIDAYDYLDLDFVSEVAANVAGQELLFSRRFDDRGNPFQINRELKDLNHKVITDYRLDRGKSYVQIDTTFENQGEEDIFIPVGDIINGSGGLYFLLPGMGYRPDLIAQAGGDTVAIIYEGFEEVDVSYGYFYELGQFKDNKGKRLPGGSISFSEVTFVGLGEAILDLLPLSEGTSPKIKFKIPKGESRTITRYLAIGDGSSSSVLEAGMDALDVETKDISGSVTTVDGIGVLDARVALQTSRGKTIATFRSDANGDFKGKIPGGTDLFSKALGDGKFRIVVDKPGYHENLTMQAGTCTPSDVDLETRPVVEVNCVLGDTGMIELAGPGVIVDADSGMPISARMTIVGEDPSPDANSGGNFSDILPKQSGLGLPFGILDNRYITIKGTFDNTEKNSINIEPNDYKLVFSHGPEYTVEERNITIDPGTTIVIEQIELKRVVATPGYVSADFHLHNITSPDSRVHPDKRVIGAAAEGLDVLHSSDHDYLFDYEPVISKIKSQGLISENSIIASIIGEEVTPNHYGHIHAFPLTTDSDSATHGAIDWTDSEFENAGPEPDYCMSPIDIAESIREFPGETIVQLNHISDYATGLPVASGWVTSRFYLESGASPLSSFADPVERRLLPHTGGPSFPLEFGTSSLVVDDFNSVELVIGYELHMLKEQFLGSTLPTWFNLLNLGFRATATGSSDSHDNLWNPMNWPRNYVASSYDPKDGMNGFFDQDEYIRSIQNQKVILSAGAFVTVNASTETGSTGTIGDVVEGKQVTLNIEAKAPSWAWFDTIEIYTNTEPIPVDDITNEPMGGVAARADEFFKPYHTPHYAMSPDKSFRVIDGNLDSWTEADGLISATVETTITVSEDTWVVVLVRGTQSTPGFRSPFPVIQNVLLDPGDEPELTESFPFDLEEIHSSSKNGSFAFALANPIFIDADQDGVFKAKYVREGTSPIE